MSIHGDKAAAAFLRGYNCAQAVALAYKEELGLDEEQVLRLSCGFGGGLSRLREVCGAFSGAVFVVGALYATPDPACRADVYARVQDLAARYKAANGRGSIVCRDLLGLPAGTSEAPAPAARTDAYYKKRPCPELVRQMADILDAYIRENPPRVSADEKRKGLDCDATV